MLVNLVKNFNSSAILTYVCSSSILNSSNSKSSFSCICLNCFISNFSRGGDRENDLDATALGYLIWSTFFNWSLSRPSGNLNISLGISRCYSGYSSDSLDLCKVLFELTSAITTFLILWDSSTKLLLLSGVAPFFIMAFFISINDLM